MDAKRDEVAAPAADTGIIVTRVFDAPRAARVPGVDRAAAADALVGAAGVHHRTARSICAPAGLFTTGMRLPDGRDIWGLGLYREIVVPSRLVYLDSFAVPTATRCRRRITG